MPSKKKKSKAAAKKIFPLRGNQNILDVIYFCALALLVSGQILIFKGHPASGLIVSFAAVCLGLAAYFGREIPSLFKGSGNPPAGSPKRGGEIKSRPKKTSLSPLSAKVLQPLVILRGAGALMALALAGIGQSYWAQAADPSTFPKGAWFYLAAVALFTASFWPWYREGLKKISLDFKWETVFLGLIAAAAVFMRVYQIATVPSGLFIDQGFEGLAALRILHEGWHPFYVEDVFHAYALALYQLALWFQLFGAGEVSLKLFYAFLGLLGFPLVYWTFRQLAGTRVALLSLFILAVMRWNINFCRNGFPTVQMSLYMFGTLAFLTYALQGEKFTKKWIFPAITIAAGVFFALGVFPFAFFSFLN
ncbi:MAG TPA: glycosyltransferase family 39 protein, partial [bacterium]|nr:glycosyltransferase family 39 protein [bacterium]